MTELAMKHLFEAALLAAGRPVTTVQLTELFDERERPSVEQVLNALHELQAEYATRGLELVEVSSGWRVQVRANCVDFVSRLWQERPVRYSRALLETLVLIAYRQPITRSEIEEIRGVAVSSTIMRTLHDRNWIRVVGHREVPGRPEILATTREFLDYFNLKSLDELPTLADLKDVETVGVQLEFDTAEIQSTAAIGEEEATSPVEPVAAADLTDVSESLAPPDSAGADAADSGAAESAADSSASAALPSASATADAPPSTETVQDVTEETVS